MLILSACASPAAPQTPATIKAAVAAVVAAVAVWVRMRIARGATSMATQVTPSIQLLIDRSGSMGTICRTRTRRAIKAMRDALVGANGVVGQLQAKAYFGASLYSATAVPELYKTAARAMDNFSQVQELIDSQRPNGNTPTPPAIDPAVASLRRIRRRWVARRSSCSRRMVCRTAAAAAPIRRASR